MSDKQRNGRPYSLIDQKMADGRLIFIPETLEIVLVVVIVDEFNWM